MKTTVKSVTIIAKIYKKNLYKNSIFFHKRVVQYIVINLKGFFDAQKLPCGIHGHHFGYTGE